MSKKQPKLRTGVGKGLVNQLERLAVCFCFFLCFVLFWFFFAGVSYWWLDRKELFIVLLKKVRSEEKGRAINPHMYRDKVS